MKLKIHIDVFGRIGICEKFPDAPGSEELNDMLQDLVDDNFHGDYYPEHPVGFYMGEFEISEADFDEAYMQLEKISEIK